ncbi:MAG TPA: TonB-dependent receptor, partial [Pyrinomonadaceae bacterium]|nr:TonB-dependent receptor [Pyrinomonadaceae bacterium]
MRIQILYALIVLLAASSFTFAQQRAGSLSGQVTDELGALVVGATVTLTLPDGSEKTALTNNEGTYSFNSLAPGRYGLKIASTGFSNYENNEVEIKAATRNTQNARLAIAIARQVVTIGDGRSLNTDSENNADAVVLRGADIDVLPDDPDALAAAAQAMAGPSAGPNGAQIFIDGFTGGRMPPKESIREVRINQNPFNAENANIGFGRIDILTKPGMDKLKVSTFYNFGDESLNSRNPFALRRQPFQIRYYGGSISGPVIAKKSSFFIDFQRRLVDDNAIINATVLTPSLNAFPFRLGVAVPIENYSVSPRFDYQLGTNHTLILRYSYSHFKAENLGVSDFSLPSRAFDRGTTEQTLQVTETAVLSPKMINETRFQFIRVRNRQEGSTVPTVSVQESFIQGGSQVGQAHNEQDSWELQNYSTRTSGRHILRFGARLRHVRINDFAPTNFGGTFTFSGGFAPLLNANDQIVSDGNGDPVLVSITSLERYRRTLLFQGRPDLRALGGGATQFSIAGGNPEAGVTQTELGFFVQDEWRVRPNLTFTAGLRYEYQTNISSKMNFAPRLFFAWAPGGTNVGSNPGAPSSSSQPKLVIRGGIGMFYDRLGERATLLANRFDGETQQDFRVANPAVLDLSTFALDGTVTNVPSADILGAFSAPQIVRQIAPDFRAPTFVMTAINIERQLPYKFTFYLVGFNYRGKHLLRLRNINAPLPGTYDPANPAAAIRPNGNIGDIYYYESAARFNDYRLFGGLRRQMSKGFSLFVNFGTGRGKTDTDCIFASIGNCFPANSYDATSEYSRVGFIPSFNFFTGGTIILPKLKINLNPFIVISSGRPFNIVTGRDTNGDGLFTERPAFATAQTDPADLRHTKFGDFDLNPGPGQALIPRNYGMGPSLFSVNVGISRAVSFGEVPAAANLAPAQPAGSKPAAVAAAKPEASKTGQPGKANAAPKPEKRYTLTFTVNIQNLLNTTNLNQPIGNLSSPQFGLSTATVNNFGFGPSGSSAAGNRRIQGQIR